MTWTLIYKNKHPVFPIEMFKVQIPPSLTIELSRKKKTMKKKKKKKKNIDLKLLYHKKKRFRYQKTRARIK